MSLLVERNGITFDSNNYNHINTYKTFLETGKWSGGCPFKLEWPFFDIPSMIQQKVVKAHLGTIANALLERSCKKTINK